MMQKKPFKKVGGFCIPTGKKDCLIRQKMVIKTTVNSWAIILSNFEN